jgi:hypothetical protein
MGEYTDVSAELRILYAPNRRRIQLWHTENSDILDPPRFLLATLQLLIKVNFDRLVFFGTLRGGCYK